MKQNKTCVGSIRFVGSMSSTSKSRRMVPDYLPSIAWPALQRQLKFGALAASAGAMKLRSHSGRPLAIPSACLSGSVHGSRMIVVT